MRYIVTAVLVLLASIAVGVAMDSGPGAVHSAVAMAGCGDVVEETWPRQQTLELVIGDCAGPWTGRATCPAEADLAAIGRLAWSTTGGLFSSLTITLYPDVSGRRVCSRVWPASQLRARFGPAPAVTASGNGVRDLVWLLLPLAGVGYCVVMVAAARSGRLVVFWFVR